jgi:hypothetical protein
LDIDHWPEVRARATELRAQSAVLCAHSASLRQAGAFTKRRLLRLRTRSADLATVVRFQQSPLKSCVPRPLLRLLA